MLAMASVPSVDDAFVRGASNTIGGPWGRHAAGRTTAWLTPLLVALALTLLTTVFAFLQKSPCLSHPYANEYQYTRVCYTDTYALYTDEGLDSHTVDGRTVDSPSVPYRDHPVEYPPIIGGLMWVAAEATHAVDPHPSVDDASRNRTFFE